MQTTRFVTDKPIVHAGFNLGKFETATAAAGDVTIEAYAAKNVEQDLARIEQRAGMHPDPSRQVHRIAEQAAATTRFLSGELGVFPYSHLEVAQLPALLSQSWPGLIYLSSTAFLTRNERQALKIEDPFAELLLSELMLAHETAHQWWGDAVLWSGYRDQWMMEALANYSSLMLLQSEDPLLFRAVMAKYREDLLEKNKEGLPLMNAGPVTFGARLSCSHFPAGYEAISYGRGTWLFHMLRSMMRDAETTPGSRRTGADEPKSEESFIRALRTVRERYEGKSITTRELLRVFEEQLPPSLWYEGKKSLDWFYRGWINGTAIPKLELQAVKYTDKAGSTAISGTILQKNVTNELVTSVPVYAAVRGKALLIGSRNGYSKRLHLRKKLPRSWSRQFRVRADMCRRRRIF